MQTHLTLLMLTVMTSVALAQDPGVQASQQANQAMIQDAQQAAQNAPQCYRCFAAKPKFSVKPGTYSGVVSLKIKDSTRGAVIYYTTDGWTPTAASTRYTGPITIASTTSLQAIAISPYGGRSRVATGVYTLRGVPPNEPVAQSVVTAPRAITNAASNATPNATSNATSNATVNSAATLFAPTKLLLARGTTVPFLFASDVSSKTADVGDKISLTLAEDLKAGDVVVVKKGAPANATVTEVDKTGMGGTPGEVFFQIDSLQVGSVVIRLHGTAAKEGEDKVGKAMGLMFIPVVPAGIFVHGKNAEIKQGASFTAFVDADTWLAPAN